MNDQDGGLIDEVGIELGPAEPSGGSLQSGVSQVELGDANERLDVEAGDFGRLRGSRRDRDKRPSLREPLEQLAVLLDDSSHAISKRRVATPSLDRLAERELHGLVQALALGPRQRFGVCCEIVIKPHRQVLRHDTMVSRLLAISRLRRCSMLPFGNLRSEAVDKASDGPDREHGTAQSHAPPEVVAVAGSAFAAMRVTAFGALRARALRLRDRSANGRLG